MDNNEGELVGKVAHYFDRAGVVVLELSAPLAVGDQIRIVGHETDFSQEVESMESEHQKVQLAKAGDSVGLKVSQRAKEGCQVYKV